MIVGRIWKAKMNPEELISRSPPKTKPEPCLVKSKITTKKLEILSKSVAINGT